MEQQALMVRPHGLPSTRVVTITTPDASIRIDVLNAPMSSELYDADSNMSGSDISEPREYTVPSRPTAVYLSRLSILDRLSPAPIGGGSLDTTASHPQPEV